jgi:inhibitor of KinA sporulation pathway (predicted exonuclease)
MHTAEFLSKIIIQKYCDLIWPVINPKFADICKNFLQMNNKSFHSCDVLSYINQFKENSAYSLCEYCGTF